MWPKKYRDYPPDAPLKQERLEPSRGIIGCEMHELNGWGTQHHIPKKRERGLLYTLFERLFRGSK